MARIINFEGRQFSLPDDATDDEVRQVLSTVPPAAAQPAQAVAEQAPVAAAPNDAAPHGPQWGFPQQIMNGATFGTLPNIEAGALAGVHGLGEALGLTKTSTGDYYDTKVGEIQDARRDYRAEHPFLGAGGDVVGGVMTGGALAKKGVTLVGGMANEGIKNIIPRVAAGAFEGGAYGAANGFGGGEGGFDNRLHGAWENARLGTLFGAAAAPAVGVVSKAGSMVRNAYVGMREPAKRAEEKLIEAVMRDKTTPDTLASRVEQASAAGQPEYRMVDAAGKNTQRIGAMATKTPGEFRETAATTLAARQQGQGDRIGGFVDDALGTGGVNAHATETAIVDARKAGAVPLYETAFQSPPPQGPYYDNLMRKPIVQQAMKNMETAASNSVDGMKDGVDLESMLVPAGEPGTVGDGVRGLSARGLDYVKRYLDGHVNSLYASTSSDDKALAPVYRDLRNSLRERLRADVPGYGDALDHYSDQSGSLDAIKTGRSVASARNPDVAKAAFDEIGLPRDRAFARVGASREIGASLDNMTSGKDKTQFFDTPNMQGKMDMLIEDPTARLVFGGRLDRERDMVRANRAMQGGSSTYENAADGADMNPGGGALAALVTGHPLRAAGLMGGRMLDGVIRAANGMNEETAKHVGEALLSSDPAKIRSLADMFATAQSTAAKPSIAPAIISAGMNAPRQRNGQRYADR